MRTNEQIMSDYLQIYAQIGELYVLKLRSENSLNALLPKLVELDKEKQAFDAAVQPKPEGEDK